MSSQSQVEISGSARCLSLLSDDDPLNERGYVYLPGERGPPSSGLLSTLLVHELVRPVHSVVFDRIATGCSSAAILLRTAQENRQKRNCHVL